MHQATLQAAWAARGWTGGVEVVDEIDSTNSELLRRSRQGRAEPTVLVARRQLAGRGRLGRQWDSAVCPGVTFSLGIPLPGVSVAGLSLAVGVSVAQSLDPDGQAGLGLKWPNDLWLDQRKLGGCLIETQGSYVVIGVGLNVQPPAQAPSSLVLAWVQERWPLLSSQDVLLKVVPELIGAVKDFAVYGFAGFASAFEARDVLRGRQVSLSDARSGWADGVNEQGALRLRTASGVQNILSAEVSVRPT